MKINVEKLDATISKLQELRRLATDPALAPFVKLTGTRTSRKGTADSETESGNGRGKLKAAVLAAAKGLKEFTAKDVFTAMQTQGHLFDGTSGAKSVANILRALAEDGQIRVLIEGKGRRPTKYGA